LKHEIGGETGQVSPHRLVEIAGADAIHRGQVTIQHHALAANQKDGVFDLWWRNQFRFVAHDKKNDMPV
jgi:hypothetical protein